MTVGGLASSTKSVVDVVKGAAPGQTILAGLEVPVTKMYRKGFA